MSGPVRGCSADARRNTLTPRLPGGGQRFFLKTLGRYDVSPHKMQISNNISIVFIMSSISRDNSPKAVMSA